jgi:hypothetical protein
MIEGLDLTEFTPFPVYENLSAAVPTLDLDPSILPHIAGEWRGSGKDMNSARHQAAYNGGSLIFARNETLSFLGSSDSTSHACVYTFTTDVLPSTPLRTIHPNPKVE